MYGFSGDLANLIFEPDKYFLSVSSDTWENVYKRLVSGEIDITGPIVILEERKKMSISQIQFLQDMLGFIQEKILTKL